MKKLTVAAQDGQENGHASDEIPAEEPTFTSLQAEVAQLKDALGQMASLNHSHTIAPEVIEQIIQQAQKRAVEQVRNDLRKSLDILETLEK